MGLPGDTQLFAECADLRCPVSHGGHGQPDLGRSHLVGVAAGVGRCQAVASRALVVVAITGIFGSSSVHARMLTS